MAYVALFGGNLHWIVTQFFSIILATSLIPHLVHEKVICLHSYLQAARMIKRKLLENARNPFKIEIDKAEDSFMCKSCNMITAQVHPGEVAIINCPNESCNYELMERAGPYIFLTSFEGFKTLRDLNVGGLLE